MAKVYLETSFFSLCVSNRKGIKEMGWKASSLEWWQTRSRNHELFVSDEVVRELAAPGFSNGPKAILMARGLAVLELTQEVADLATVLVEDQIMPRPATKGDAIHVAVAIAYGMDYLLTWNVKHLANPNKRTHLAIVCMRLGLQAPTLVTPDLL